MFFRTVIDFAEQYGRLKMMLSGPSSETYSQQKEEITSDFRREGSGYGHINMYVRAYQFAAGNVVSITFRFEFII